MNKKYVFIMDVALVYDQNMIIEYVCHNIISVLMNSFNTDEDTHKVIRKYSGLRVRILTFNQSRYPRINRESLMPIAKEIQTEKDIDA